MKTLKKPEGESKGKEEEVRTIRNEDIEMVKKHRDRKTHCWSWAEETVEVDEENQANEDSLRLILTNHGKSEISRGKKKSDVKESNKAMEEVKQTASSNIGEFVL